jgi:hypothetical protein
MESPPSRVQSVVEAANFQGIDSILTWERASHPSIREQIVELLYQEEKALADKMLGREWVPLHPEKIIADGETDQDLLEATDNSGDVVIRSQLEGYRENPPSKEAIRAALNERIARVASVTEISFGTGELPEMFSMPVEWELPGQGTPTVKQKAITLAHEKGHRIRPYFSDFLDNHFQSGFDITRMEYTEAEYARDIELRAYQGADPISFEESKQLFINYLFTARELAERMNQLKCYFGMSGNEQFTKEHLAYARKQYVLDTGIDNCMTQFFQAITPETEHRFIELINNSGI